MSCILNFVSRRVFPSAHLSQLIVNPGNIRIHLEGEKLWFVLRHGDFHVVICIDLQIIHRHAVLIFIYDPAFRLLFLGSPRRL